MWSLGVVMWIILFAEFPFDADEDSDLIRKIKTTQPNWDNCSNVSADLKDLLQGLLEKDQSKRLSITEALNHPAFKDASEVTS